MPTVLRIGPYQFHFYVNDGNEPVHIHVTRDRGKAKYWLDPIRRESAFRLNVSDLRKIEAILKRRQHELIEAWHEYFNK